MNSLPPPEQGPKSELARYAFGLSDVKPHWSYWAIIAGMILFIITQIWRQAS